MKTIYFMKTIKSITFFGAIASTIIMTGCASFTHSVDEQGNEQVSNKVKAGGIASGIMILEGLVKGRSGKDILKRTVVVGGLATGAGHLFDKQNEEMAAAFRQKQIQSEVRDGLVRATIEVHFTSGSTQISPQDMGKINEVSQIANQHAANYTIAIVGHTDSQGPEQMNMNLSVNRAKSVGFELARRTNNPIQTGGFGEERPIADNSTAAGRSKNRRVEFFFRPPAQ